MSNFPPTVKAFLIRAHGGVDVIELADVPFPEQKPNEVLVKVNYAGINFAETKQREGTFAATSLPMRLGFESSGTVVGLPTDPDVLNDEQYKKRGIELGARVWVLSFGGLAGYVSVPWASTHTIPAFVSLRDAAALVLQGFTALSLMTEAHSVAAGETVLVHTVAGGLGLLFSQIAKARGATVIGTTSSAEKAAIAKEHGGADHVILYTSENTVERTLELTGGEGVHASFDSTGKDTFDDNFKLLRRKGSLVSLGAASGPVPPVELRKLGEKNIRLSHPSVFNYIVTPEETHNYSVELFKLVGSGAVKTYIYKEYPFTALGLRQAHIDIAGRGTIGKLIIKVADE